MIMTGKKIYNSDGRSSEDKALDKFAEMMIEKIKTLQNDWKKPWFTDKSISWPRNLSGREYNGMNALLLMMHCEKKGYKLPVFCTFDRVAGLNYTKDKQGVRQQIKDNNGQELPKVSILKGEKSFPVFITTFTVVDKETKEKIKYDDYKQLSEEEKKGYNVYPKLQVYTCSMWPRPIFRKLVLIYIRNLLMQENRYVHNLKVKNFPLLLSTG